MKKSILLLCAALLVGAQPMAYGQEPVLTPSSSLVQAFCGKVESYQQGSNHYFVCLETGERLLAEGATGQQLVDGVCQELEGLFYDPSSYGLCFQDGYALLGQ